MTEAKVEDVMTRLVVTFRPQDSIKEAARVLLRNGISGAPVIDEGRLVGVVSEADIVAAYAPPAPQATQFALTHPLAFLLRGTQVRDVKNNTVDDVMSRKVVSVAATAPIWEAARLMDRHGVRRLPVLDSDGYVAGIVARADLIRAMARDDEDVAEPVKSETFPIGPKLEEVGSGGRLAHID